MKNRNIWCSIACAAKGLALALRTEKNYRFYLLNILLTLPVNIFLGFSATEHLIYAVCAAGVFSAECVNTALERLCDYLTDRADERIRIVKDVAAGGVLCWGIAFYAAEILMVGGKILG